MANIKKTFNFRNGVQVDEDNLIVNATGLVGIGTTIPTEALDVRGTTKVVGLVTSQEGFVGVFTAHTSSLGTVALSTSIIGAGVSIKSGIITSNAASGLVTYYGDARFLQGMPTSQWEDTNAGLGVSSIYNTGGTVGVGTTSPQFTLQVGNNVNGGEKGVGISSSGDLKASGIITATSFVGSITGGVTGDVTGRITGDVVGNINSSGVSTIATLNATNVNIAGLSTHRVAFTNASDNLTDSADLTFNDTHNILNIVGTTDTDQLNVSGVSTLGVSTFTSTVSFGATSSFNDNSKLRFGDAGDLKLYHNGTRSYVQDDISGDLRICSNDIRFRSSDDGTTSFYVDHNGETQLYHNTSIKLKTSGVGVTVYNQLDTTNIVASGVITATTELNSPLVGVGTDDPATDIQVRKSGGAQIRVTSDTDAAIVSVGRVAGAGNGTNAAFRYGNNAVAFPYSNSNAVDIINYDIGNVNFYLSVGNAGNAQGDFHWHKGGNTSRLMTLTNSGNLGIGITNPTHKLNVVGTSSFGGNSSFSGNVTIGGNLSISGSFNSNLTGNVTGNLTGNVNATSGLSTFYDVKVTRLLGVGVDADTNIPFKVNIAPGSRFSVQGQGKIGLGTDTPRAGVDFADASGGDETKRFMVPPSLGTVGINSLTAIPAGAVIYNTATNKLQVYNGSAWQNCN